MSGSMSSLQGDTIGGYNSYINTIKKNKTNQFDIYVTLVLFNNKSEFVYEKIPINQVKDLTDQKYIPQGCTALNDAIGISIGYLDKYINNSKNKENIQVSMFITTDGMENSSVEYKQQDIKKMVTEKQNKGWDIVFAACNIDSFAAGDKYGINRNNVAQMDAGANGQRRIYAGLGARFSRAMKNQEHLACACSPNQQLFAQSDSLQQIYNDVQSQDDTQNQ